MGMKTHDSRLGIASTIIAAVVSLCIAGLMVFASHFAVTTSDPSYDPEPYFRFLHRMLNGMFFLSAVGIGVGIVGLLQKDTDHTFARIGVLVNVLLTGTLWPTGSSWLY